MSKRIQKILFVRPPVHLWPILNESDNFLMPLGFPYLAAYLRARHPDLELRIVDCLPEKIGWASLERIIAEEKPDLLAVGEMIVYSKAAMRVVEIAKRLDPDVVTVAGGHFHSHMPRYSFETWPGLDHIVMFEGEETFVALVEALNNGGDLARVEGVATRESGEVRINPPRKLLSLDDLPSPAYDLMPIHKYSPFGKLWHKAITIQGSRGCPYACNFCSWTALEGDHELLPDGSMKVNPVRRQIPVERVLEEIDLLYNEHKIRYLFWVDATWNYDDEWLDRLCTEIIRREYKLGWWAFVRADLMLEQEKKGLLEKMVKAGLRHCLFGGERPVKEELEAVGKHGMSPDALRDICGVLKEKYPQVFRQATFTTGIRSETAESMDRLARYSREVGLDFAAYHPLQPYPGTPLWDEASREGWIEEEDFSNFDMFYPVMSSEQLSRTEIAKLTSKTTSDFVAKQPLRYFLSLFSIHPMRRRLHWWFLFSIGRVMFYDLLGALRGKNRFQGFSGLNQLKKPRWYDD